METNCSDTSPACETKYAYITKIDQACYYWARIDYGKVVTDEIRLKLEMVSTDQMGRSTCINNPMLMLMLIYLKYK